MNNFDIQAIFNNHSEEIAAFSAQALESGLTQAQLDQALGLLANSVELDIADLPQAFEH